ncbi:MAG TPA: T9SS type A sorting domain-containing protein, partial [Bacteroidia bacterium]|nr:T9SS type A sorting domain-containing protein [Bacteroidia bacterium]
RIFHHPTRNKFYVVYAARHYNVAQPPGMLQEFRWREYDNTMTFTGNEGVLPGPPGAGDYAMVMVDTNYYHLTNYGNTATGTLQYKLSKLDDNFNLISSVVITLDPHDSNIDQLMNYTNGKLIIGAMNDTCCTPPTTPPQPSYHPKVHLFQYDLNLNPVAPDQVLPPQAYSWGASCIFNNNNYYIVSTDDIGTHVLYCYTYDANFNYISTTQINPNGQWSQGILWDGTYYYVSFHSGDHNHGNVAIAVYDANWNQVLFQPVTNNPYSAGLNAHRPVMCRVGNLLYVSYDLETYNTSTGANNKDWQAHVDAFQVNTPASVENFAASLYTMNLFPNPAQGTITISTRNFSAGPKTIEVSDLSGRMVGQLEFDEENYTLSLYALKPGIYFVKVSDAENNAVVRKMVVR